MRQVLKTPFSFFVLNTLWKCNRWDCIFRIKHREKEDGTIKQRAHTCITNPSGTVCAAAHAACAYTWPPKVEMYSLPSKILGPPGHGIDADLNVFSPIFSSAISSAKSWPSGGSGILGNFMSEADMDGSTTDAVLGDGGGADSRGCGVAAGRARALRWRRIGLQRAGNETRVAEAVVKESATEWPEDTKSIGYRLSSGVTY